MIEALFASDLFTAVCGSNPGEQVNYPAYLLSATTENNARYDGVISPQDIQL